MRTGALAIPEAFAPPCPWCRRAPLAEGRCSYCSNELRCSGFGHVHTRARHALSCWEVACDLRYLPADADWSRVIAAYERRGESLGGHERAAGRGA